MKSPNENDDYLEKTLKEATNPRNWPDALSQIASVFWGTNDKKARKLLALLVLNDSNPSDMRLAAYCALFEVCNRDLWALPPVDRFNVPEDFDLPFLHQCTM
jgi:hypothetical protein